MRVTGAGADSDGCALVMKLLCPNATSVIEGGASAKGCRAIQTRGAVLQWLRFLDAVAH
jgi:hypothetical protein